LNPPPEIQKYLTVVWFKKANPIVSAGTFDNTQEVPQGWWAILSLDWRDNNIALISDISVLMSVKSLYYFSSLIIILNSSLTQ